jgi:hypothetical protein
LALSLGNGESQRGAASERSVPVERARNSKLLSPKITRHEALAALGLAVTTSALLLLPYLLGYGLARPGTQYTGLIMNPEDAQTYFAKILQGSQGHWQYVIPFTPEAHSPAFVGGFYLALGQAARLFSVSLEFAWHSARFLAGVFLFLSAFLFISTFLNEIKARWFAYLIAVFGSGLGWLLFLLGQSYWLGAFPIDFKMPEAHLFFTALTFPHVATGTGLLLLVFWLLVLSTQGRRKGWPFALLAGIVNLALGVVYPFLIYVVAFTIGLYWVYLCVVNRRIEWRDMGRFGLAFLVPLPLYVYYAYTLQTNVVFHAWDAQAITPSPPWPHYLIAYGPLLLAALPLLVHRKDNTSFPRTAFLWLWIVAAAILAYVPLNPQRRFVQGVQVPLAILATISLLEVILPFIQQSRVFRWLAARPRYSVEGLTQLLMVAFVAFVSLSNLYLLLDVSVTAAFRQPYPFFRSDAEMEAAAWLRENAEDGDVTLSAYQTGNYLAARVGYPVLVGHWAETVDWQVKMEQTKRFFGMATDDWRRALLERYSIDFVWFGPQEKSLGEFAPGHFDLLRPVFTNSEITIYAVNW